VPLPQKPPGDEKPPAQEKIRLELPQLIIGCAQSNGKQRDHNEDALLTLTTNLSSDRGNTTLGLYIVADGMGGHKHGEEASELAVRAISSQIVRKVITLLLSPKPGVPSESIQEIMQEGAQEAHRVIVKNAPGGGTTITSLLILDKQMTLSHVGDSRAYTIAPDGEIHALTRDHSLVMRMIELGQITTQEAAVHPQRNVLYRALGQGELFAPDIGTYPLPESGHILLCSDGLWGVVSEESIARLVNSAPNPQVACQLLIDAANEGGGPDNISAILIRIPD